MEQAGTKQTVTLWQYLQGDVDPAQTTGPLAAYCFMTGYMCVALFYPVTSVSNRREVMSYLSLPSSYGVASKLVTLPRYVKDYMLRVHGS